jgi:signal transduction histidine kinase
MRSTGAEAQLKVTDTGTGISESDLPHLFERFRRIDGARRRSHEGSGIGLALVQELVECMAVPSP